jgi:hypothetical protein
MKRPPTSNTFVRRRLPDRADLLHPSSLSLHPSEGGVALILTLGILALVTLLLIAFVTSMRVENAASKNFNEVIKARELARAGVDEAVGAIRMAAPPVSTLTNYVTAPGVIYTWASGSGTWTSNSLFTSVNPNDPNPLQAKMVNLNTNFVITGSGTVYNVANSLNSQLWVGWSNVTALATVNGFSQPLLVGRYAYWVDDESAKVNLNTAGTRAGDLYGYGPDAIDLGNLGTYSFSSAEIFTLTNYVHLTRPLDTIESMVMADPPLTVSPPNVSGNTFSNTQFYVTVHATSPDVTPWGAQRLNLNNLGINGTNPPTMAQKRTAVGTIATALSDPNLAAWFGGQTFASKYNQAHEIQQIAANIVDYITVDPSPTDPGGGANDTSQPSYLGLKETPYLNQVAIKNSFTITAGNVPPAGTLTISTTYSAQLWYMYNNSGGWNASGGPWVEVTNVPPITLSGGVSGSITFNPATITTGILPMGAGPSSWQLVSTTVVPVPQSFPVPNVNVPVVATQNAGSLTAIFSSTQGRMDWAQVPVPASALTITTSGSLTSASQCVDPRIKPSLSANWGSIPASQLGSQNLPSAATLSQGNGSIIGDGDMSCHSWTTGRQRGTMCPGELAYIHTGIPWRTLFLEPRPSGEAAAGSIPDWLAVDLFSTPSITNVDVTGRMNINAAINSVVNPSGGSFVLRLAPLYALLGGSIPYTVVAPNIYNFSVHNTPAVTSFVQPSLFKAFTTEGQVCEVVGLADSSGQPKATREAPAQAIVNIVTPRSNTFTIWCLAQAVKKVDLTPGRLQTFTPGTDVVTGEAKVQAIVERTVDNSSGTPTVKFRTLYYRYYYQ